jgi:hypothetical protein
MDVINKEVDHVKGTMSERFLLQVSSSPKPLKVLWDHFEMFSKTCGNIHKSRCKVIIKE